MRILAGLLISLQLLAQSAPPPNPAAEKIRLRAQALSPGAKVTVNMRDGNQYCGGLLATMADSFSMQEVDLHRTLTLRYEEVEKLRKGYGGRNIRGKRIYPRTSLITIVAFTLGLLTLIVVLLATNNA